jgi:dinuclear metal center YbgI/SA1388 family protein
MLIEEFDSLVREILDIERPAAIDKALNGLQVTREDRELKSAAFAVDACMESFTRAREWGADLLFTHHGLFFGRSRAVTGVLFRRLSYLLENRLALYSVHLPLDLHPRLGNNAALAGLLGLNERCGFGDYHGFKIGVKGTLPAASTPAELMDKLGKHGIIPPRCLAFGPAIVNTVGIVSGGGASDVREAIDEKLDLFITGDASHDIYHECAEAGINVIFAGHYLTEVWGMKALQKAVTEQTGLRTCFIDIPTGF